MVCTVSTKAQYKDKKFFFLTVEEKKLLLESKHENMNLEMSIIDPFKI